MDDVQAYIQDHYTEQGLSVSRIADEYGFTVSMKRAGSIFVVMAQCYKGTILRSKS